MIEKEKDELLEKVFKIIQRSQLVIPILDGYKEIKDKDNAIFKAKSEDNSIEQFLEGGQLEEKETFDQKIADVVLETKEAMKKSNLSNPKIEFLGTYDTNLFKYKIYIQDNIQNNIIVKQLNAYFVEPGNNYFYEITLSAPPIPLEEDNDQLVKNILKRLTVILDNVKYNDNLMK